MRTTGLDQKIICNIYTALSQFNFVRWFGHQMFLEHDHQIQSKTGNVKLATATYKQANMAEVWKILRTQAVKKTSLHDQTRRFLPIKPSISILNAPDYYMKQLSQQTSFTEKTSIIDDDPAFSHSSAITRSRVYARIFPNVP